MNVSLMRNVASRLYGVLAFASTTHTAGQAQEDDDAVDGLAFDRGSLVQDALSGLLQIPYTAANIGGEDTITVSLAIHDSDDGESYDEFTEVSISDTVISENGNGLIQAPVNLAGARQHIRAVITTTFGADDTDTLTFSGVFTLGGFNELPVEVDESGDSF